MTIQTIVSRSMTLEEAKEVLTTFRALDPTYGMPGGDVHSFFTSDGLSYFIRHPRLHTPYGYSAVEDCIGVPDSKLAAYCRGSRFFDVEPLQEFLESVVSDLTRRYVYVSV